MLAANKKRMDKKNIFLPTIKLDEEMALKRLANLIKFLRGEVSLNEFAVITGKTIPEPLACYASGGFMPRMTQAGLGEKLGISYAGVQGLEKKGTNSFPRLGLYIKIAKICNLTLDELTNFLFDFSTGRDFAKTSDTEINQITAQIRQLGLEDLEAVARVLSAVTEACLVSSGKQATKSEEIPEPEVENIVELSSQQKKRLAKVLLGSLESQENSLEEVLAANGVEAVVWNTILSELDSSEIIIRIKQTQLDRLARLCCKVRTWINEDGIDEVWLNPRKNYESWDELKIDLDK